ncbi:hypothetical protein [Streptomyces sp. NBC_01538]|uniref:hypothetical protein n=1 Tax=Streptomyces sp. NBC_01538 TaxID=2903897 RepID=UPI003869B5B2
MIRVEWSPEIAVSGEAALVRHAFPDTATMTAYRGPQAVGSWSIPVDGTHVRREARVLPYIAPTLVEQHPQRRRGVMQAMLDAVQQRYDSLELPMAPSFHDVQACRDLGIAVEWRHTNILALDADWRVGYSATVRQQLRATASVSVDVGSPLAAFRFDRALVAQSPEAMAQRGRFAAWAGRQGTVTCLTARHEDRVVGQLLALILGDTGYSMHSWFERTGPRGVPSLLIDEAALALRAKGCRAFDLEGSVVPTVDYFMSGFGATVTPYPYLYWHYDRESMAALLMSGISAGLESADVGMIGA